MAPGIGNKRAQHLRRARAAKGRKIGGDCYLLQSVLQFLDVEVEREGGDLQGLQPSPHTGKSVEKTNPTATK